MGQSCSKKAKNISRGLRIGRDNMRMWDYELGGAIWECEITNWEGQYENARLGEIDTNKSLYTSVFDDKREHPKHVFFYKHNQSHIWPQIWLQNRYSTWFDNEIMMRIYRRASLSENIIRQGYIRVWRIDSFLI